MIIITPGISVLARLFSGGAAPLGCYIAPLGFTIFTAIPVMTIRFW